MRFLISPAMKRWYRLRGTKSNILINIGNILITRHIRTASNRIKNTKYYQQIPINFIYHYYSLKNTAMKKRKLLFLLTLFLGLSFTATSQAPRLIFSEWAAPAGWGHHYFELTNVGDSTLHLWDFKSAHFGWWQDIRGASNADYTLVFKDVILDSNDAFLAKGESFVISLTWDGVNDIGEPQGRPELNAVSDLLLYHFEGGNDDLAPGEDSVSFSYNWFRPAMSFNGECKVLYYQDNVICDAINNWIDFGTGMVFTGEGAFPVAGVSDAVETQAFIRKSNIIQGDTTLYDWAISAGNDREESEWIPVPYDRTNSWNPVVFSSVGNHPAPGDSSDIQMTSETVAIDMEAGTITVPWGIRKGAWNVINSRSQGIFDEITWGEGMAWNYKEQGDTSTTACQTGDTLNVYAFGTRLDHKAFRIIAGEAADNNALALPKRAFDHEFSNTWLWYPGEDIWPPQTDGQLYQPYEITENVPGMDTIRYLPFALRVDSLLAYIEMAPNASYEFIWIDGMERVDLKDGDILRITAEDNTTVKDYYLSVEDVAESTISTLTAITWPDIPEDLGWMGWSGDTIPGFNPAILNYSITVPFGITNVPALTYIKEDLNSTVKVDRAISLRGSREDRTTTFTVTSQDTTQEDGSVNVYKITFEAEVLEENIQPFLATPIISEFLYRQNGSSFFVEIANVGNRPINLEKYMFMAPLAGGNPALTIPMGAESDSINWHYRYSKYIPGYKYGTQDEWRFGGMNAKLIPDLDIETILDPEKTFVMGSLHANMLTDPVNNVQESQVNVHWSATWENHMGELGEPFPSFRTCVPRAQFTDAIMIFKVLNDSIYDGTKGIWDVEDFTLVDLLGNWAKEAWDLGDGDPGNNNSDWRKKPHAWRPNLEENGGFEGSRDWFHYWRGRPGEGARTAVQLKEDIGNYSHDPITVYMSTVGSDAYLVDPGFEGNLKIIGVVTGSTVEEVFNNISKADTGQVLFVISSGTGLELDSADLVANGDTLMVLSADTINTTKYVLEVSAGGLDDDALLVVKPAYTGSYTVTVDGSTGTITGSGIKWGVPLKEIMAALIVPELATYAIIDKDDNMVPLRVRNFDGFYSDVRINDSIFIEVTAQNGTTVIKYQLKPESASSDAFVVSSVFLVDQDNMTISLVPFGTIVDEFKRNIQAVTGATMKVLDKYGFEREEGYMSYDDKLQVVSQDGIKKAYYYLNFIDEVMFDKNEAPTLSLETASTNILVGGKVNLKATASDDGMPLPAVLTALWEVISGDAGSVSIANSGALETDATFSKAGTYVLRITVDDGEMKVSRQLTVGVSTPGNAAPTVSVATASFTIVEGESINVSATASDDGNPIGSTLTYTWAVKTGVTENVTIASPDQPDSEVTFSKAGVYTLEITVTDGELIATDIVVVVVEKEVGIAPVLEPAMQLYPNPVSGILNLELQNTGNVRTTVKLFNITGQAVYNGEIAQSKLQIDVRDLDAGLYIITVCSGEHVFTERIQIVK